MFRRGCGRVIVMPEPRDIYKKTDRGPESAPPAAPTPPDHTPPHRNAIIVVLLMAAAMAGLAIYFSLQEGETVGEFDYLLTTPAPPTNLPVAREMRTPPETAAIESLLSDLGTGTQPPPPTVSPQKIAEAMGHIRSAQQYVRGRDMEAAEREVGKALTIWPDMNLAVRMLGSIYTQRGQFDQAIALLERALAKDPFNAETLNNLAINYLQKNMPAKAEELLITSLQIRPDYAVAFINLGFTYLRQARYDLAAENFEIGLQQMPGNPGTINNLAVCLIRLGDFEGARRHLLDVIQEFPDRPIAYFNLAISYVLEQDHENALAWIRRGAEYATPSQLQSFLSDADFDSIRPMPEFQQIIRDRFPDIPHRRPNP